ncbi:FAD-dependent monooxygenase [Yaniella flava]|uniref:FAD-dependent monooxygenase n=1 Tax=Yaniella flava TaxID=287930 RepID=A0ABN2U0I1_9MICC|nr:FAD-dependent monooxygenase [Micrococcaceae bacterium]
MRIAVIGAGIAGLVAAYGFQRDGHDVVVFEQRRDPSADGAGLTLFGNGLAALDAVGLGGLVRELSSDAIAGMRAGQRHPSGRWLFTLPPRAVASLRSIHRVTLHQALVEQLQPGTLHTGASAIVAADGSGNVTVARTTQRFDVVIAADGRRSRNRAALGLDPGLSYAGYTAWRGVTNVQVELDGAVGETWGRGRIFGIVPLPENRLYWFSTLNTPAGTEFGDEHAAVRTTFGTWHAPIPQILEATSPHDVIRHDIYDLAKPLTALARGRTVLMGDAAHAMTPNLGQGAGQGIEDAATITLLLRGAQADGVDDALASYSRIRSRRTASLWRQSRLMAKVAQASGPVTGGLRDLGMRVVPGRLAGVASAGMHFWDEPAG